MSVFQYDDADWIADARDEDGAASGDTLKELLNRVAAIDWDPSLHPRDPVTGRFINLDLPDLSDVDPDHDDFVRPDTQGLGDVTDGDIIRIQDHRDTFAEKKVGKVQEAIPDNVAVDLKDGETVEFDPLLSNDFDISGRLEPGAGDDDTSILDQIESDLSNMGPDDEDDSPDLTPQEREERQREIYQGIVDDLPAVPDEPSPDDPRDGADVVVPDMEGDTNDADLTIALEDALERGSMLGVTMELETVEDDSDYGPFRDETTVPFYDNPEGKGIVTADVLVDPEDYANLQAAIHKAYRDTSRLEHFGGVDSPEDVRDFADHLQTDEADVPMPYVQIGENGTVQSLQEGRHRALAAMAAGLDKIPVRFFADKGKEGTPNFPVNGETPDDFQASMAGADAAEQRLRELANRVHASSPEAVLHAAQGTPLKGIPGVPDSPSVITRDMLERTVRWKMEDITGQRVLDGEAEAAVLPFAADWNPSLHPRGPDGKFIERPWNIDLAPGDINDTSTHALVEFLGDVNGEPDMDSILSDDEVTIDGIPDDVDSVAELKDRMGDPVIDEDVGINPNQLHELDDGDVIRTPDGPATVDATNLQTNSILVQRPDGDGLDDVQLRDLRRNTVDVYDVDSVGDLPSQELDAGDIPDLPEGVEGHGVLDPDELDPGWTAEKVENFKEAANAGRINVPENGRFDGPFGIDEGIAALSFDMLAERDNPTNYVNLASTGSFDNINPYIQFKNEDAEFLESAADRISDALPEDYHAVVDEDDDVLRVRHKHRLVHEARGDFFDDATDAYPDLPATEAKAEYAKDVDDPVGEYGFPTNETRAELDKAFLGGIRAELDARSGDDDPLTLDTLTLDDVDDGHPRYTDATSKFNAREGDILRVSPRYGAHKNNPFIGEVLETPRGGDMYRVQTKDGEELYVGAGQDLIVKGFLATDTPDRQDLQDIDIDSDHWVSTMSTGGAETGDIIQTLRGEYDAKADKINAEKEPARVLGRDSGAVETRYTVEFPDGVVETHSYDEDYRFGRVYQPPEIVDDPEVTPEIDSPESGKWRDIDNESINFDDFVRFEGPDGEDRVGQVTGKDNHGDYTVFTPENEKFNAHTDPQPEDDDTQEITGTFREDLGLSDSDFVVDERNRTDLTELDGTAAERREKLGAEWLTDELPSEAVKNEEIPIGSFIGRDRYADDADDARIYKVIGYTEDHGVKRLKVESDYGGTNSLKASEVEHEYRAIDPRDTPDVTIPEDGWGDEDDPRSQRKDAIKSVLDDVLPKAADSPDNNRDHGIDDSTFEDAKENIASHLAASNDKEHAEHVAARMTSIGHVTGRAHASPSIDQFGSSTGSMAINNGESESTIIHELGHVVGYTYGFEGGNNDMDNQTRPMPDFAWQSPKYDVPDKYGLKTPPWSDQENTDAVGGLTYNFSEWEDEVEAEIGTGLSSRNFTEVDSTDDIPFEEGTMIRLDQNRMRRLDTPDADDNWRIAEVEETRVEMNNDRADVILESRDGERVPATLQDFAGGDPEVEWRDDAPYEEKRPIYGKRNGTPDDWESNPPDPDEWLGSMDIDDTQEAGRNLGNYVNKAWFRQAVASRELGADEDTRKEYAIKSGYSAKQAHETWSRIHQMMRGTDVNTTQRANAAYTLVKNHSDLVEAYRQVYDIPAGMKQAMNTVLEQEGADFRFDVIEPKGIDDITMASDMIEDNYYGVSAD